MNMKKIANSILQTKASEELEEQVKEEIVVQGVISSVGDVVIPM